jgi:predicted class III extradiol MEMO1 family dioxygenase
MLQYIASHDIDSFYQFIKAEKDCRRVCGFPPILTYLASVAPTAGKLLKYEQWHETATNSAVTYASMVFNEIK